MLPEFWVNVYIALKFLNLSIFFLKFTRYSKIFFMSKIAQKLQQTMINANINLQLYNLQKSEKGI